MQNNETRNCSVISHKMLWDTRVLAWNFQSPAVGFTLRVVEDSLLRRNSLKAIFAWPSGNFVSSIHAVIKWYEAYIRTLPSSPAEANILGFVGFQEIALQQPFLWASSFSTTEPFSRWYITTLPSISEGVSNAGVQSKIWILPSLPLTTKLSLAPPKELLMMNSPPLSPDTKVRIVSPVSISNMRVSPELQCISRCFELSLTRIEHSWTLRSSSYSSSRVMKL